MLLLAFILCLCDMPGWAALVLLLNWLFED